MIENQIFIVGCGRSGTTILGYILACHPDICYLNEPRWLWEAILPESDVWSQNAIKNGGRLFFDSDSLSPEEKKAASSLFTEYLRKSGRSILIEKTPENCFRMHLIKSIFSDAKFIHINRDPVSVAQSIEKACQDERNQNFPWYGLGDVKWKSIEDYCSSISDYTNLPSMCDTNFERGLLEWRLSTEAVFSFCKNHFETCLFIEYDQLVDDTTQTLAKIIDFMELPPSKEVFEFARNNMASKSSNQKQKDLSIKERQILGLV